ncbi:MAG: hypothetical protein ACLQEQ_02345 [Nitrososphaerales archaeon]
MTDVRQLAGAYLVAEIVSAVAVGSLAGLALVALSLVALLAGYSKKLTFSTAAAGLFLYYPLAVAFGHLVPGAWGYLASATSLILLSERLSFEYYLSSALETTRGVDEESSLVAVRLSRSHSVRLVWYALLAFTVSAASLLASTFLTNVPVLAAASVLLVFALWAYTRR